MSGISVSFAGILLMLTSTASTAEQFWSHKDWHVSADKGRCRLATGGDGDDTFSVEFSEQGLNGSAQYEPLLIRGYPSPLAIDDSVTLIIDGRPYAGGEELLVHDGTNEWQEYFIAATLPGGFVPALVVAFSAADAFELRKGSEPAGSIARFSLRGFTANLLKAAEWCHFDPKNLPAS